MQVQFLDAGDLKAVARELRRHADGKRLRKELTDNIRAVLRPIVPQVKAAYLAGPSTRGKARRRGGSLRSLLARSVRMEVRTSGKLAGARIRADGRRMPAGMGALPKHWEGPPEGRWRHPVFGNREVWVGQESHPTFYRAVEPNQAAAQREIDQAVRQILDKIEKAR